MVVTAWDGRLSAMPDELLTRLGPTSRNTWGVSAARVDLTRPRPTRPVDVAARPQDLRLDLARCAVVVVDMQNDFCSDGGWLHSIGVDVAAARAPIDPLRRLLPRLRAAGVPVVWLNWGNREDRANLPPGVLHVYNPDGASTGIGDHLPGATGGVLEAGSWGAAIVDDLEVDASDVRVDKYRMSGFWDTPLDTILRNLDVATVLFAGVNADQCVLATLVDAACAGFDVVMLTDCCATTSPAFCWDATVYNVRQCFGFTANGADLAAAIESAP
jgi:ureidoacrylate peracid hydrolase